MRLLMKCRALHLSYRKDASTILITLSGIIGSGKSSLTEILSKELGTKAYYEPVEDNPVLPIFTRATKLRPKNARPVRKMRRIRMPTFYKHTF